MRQEFCVSATRGGADDPHPNEVAGANTVTGLKMDFEVSVGSAPQHLWRMRSRTLQNT